MTKLHSTESTKEPRIGVETQHGMEEEPIQMEEKDVSDG